MPEKRYLGDGVYVEIDSFQTLILTAENGSRNIIYLEPDIWKELKNFAKECGL